ncbi:MAG: rane protein [Marmoricola sp.]|nr:rane protein [Marmoricola sp.]
MAAFTTTSMGTPPIGPDSRARVLLRTAADTVLGSVRDARLSAGATRELAVLGPVEQLRAGRFGRRISQLAVGLVLYGLTLAMIIRGAVGASPWDVLHQGLARHLPFSIGEAVVLMSLVVLLLWIPLRVMPGLGTIANSFVVGFAADLFLSLISTPADLNARLALAAAGIVLNAAATALYIGSQFGPGPRDGLMTGLHRRTGASLRVVRTGIELTVVVLGFLLGGIVGIGTVAYTLLIGPLVQLMLPYAIVDLPAAGPVVAEPVAPVAHDASVEAGVLVAC